MQNKELLDKLRQHDETGMAEFLQRYSPLMRYIIAPLLPDPREQEECLSDVAMRVWNKIDQFDEMKGSFTSWLTALTRNTALNRAKARKHREMTTQEVPNEYPSAESGPEEQLLRRERLEALQKVMHGLRRTDQQLFYRKYYYLQSTAQIAAEMGMTERAVEGRLYRVKKKLRSALGGERYE